MAFQIKSVIFLMILTMIASFVHVSKIRSDVITRLCTKRFLTTNIFIVGKKNGGEQFIYDGYAEYEKRLTPVMKINTVFLKSDEALVEATKAVKGTGRERKLLKQFFRCIYTDDLSILIITFTVIALDENGSEYSSRDFSNVVYKGLEDGGANLTFVIGGFAGLPSEIKKSYPLISLSKVFTTCDKTRNANIPFSIYKYKIAINIFH
jgi:23S rRNA pseudoU1915 N3-methylase RlmH